MTTKTAIIKPGLLVLLRTSVSGGITYARTTLDADGVAVDETAQVERWETTKVVADAAEHEAAVKVRDKATAMIRAVCRNTSFGPVCPLDREDELRTAIRAARRLVAEFNDTARVTRVTVYAMPGRIASTDEEATAAIAAETRAMIDQMDAAVIALDVDAIRAAADKAREMQAILADDQAAALSDAIKAARKAARQIVARVQQNGEAAAVVAADLQRGAIIRARAAFLDLDAILDVAPDAAAAAAPAVDAARVAGLDMDDEEPASDPVPTPADKVASTIPSTGTVGG